MLGCTSQLVNGFEPIYTVAHVTEDNNIYYIHTQLGHTMIINHMLAAMHIHVGSWLIG